MRVVLTGGTSGIGLYATRLLAPLATEMIVGVRRGNAPAGARAEPLDLASLTSVKAFAAAVGAEPIDRLILNAGSQPVGRSMTEDGFERTFGVNHLAHYVLVRLLLPAMASDGRIILTASGTHDPDKKTGMPPPHHADAVRLAYPDTDPERDRDDAKAGRRAYSTSKLLNVMTVRELARRTQDSRPDLMIAAFDPGFTPGTGLARDYGAFVNQIFRRVLPLLIRGPRVSTPRRSGGLLAQLATDVRYRASRGNYWAYHRGTLIDEAPSELARNDAACAKLWADSADLAGLPRE